MKLKFTKKHLTKLSGNWRLQILAALVFIGGVGTYFFWDLPNPMNLTRHPAPASTKLLDRHGKLIYEIYEQERRTPIQLSSLPKFVWQATLAAEDKNFYQHGGFSVTSIFRAFLNTFFRGNVQGGSTITQQLVKNALLTPDRTVRRKVREFTLSYIVEFLYSKDQILEMYLNQVPYGGTAYGLEEASQSYFGKSSSQLSLAQAALLAGLPQAPSYYSPFGPHPEYAKERQKYVLTQMLDNKFITREQFSSASAETLAYSVPPTLQAPHFALWVKDLLAQKYGLQTVEEKGLVVTTTLDLNLQNFAQDTVTAEVGKLKNEHVGNGAALVLHPKTGEVLAMVGSQNYFDTAHDGNVNVVLSQRQPGSSIKPVNYALGLERHLLTPSTLLADKPTCFQIPDQKDLYCPQNYDSQFHGPTQVRFALGNSFNIPAVKALTINGLDDFVASASAFGITSFTDPSKYGPSITLGGAEVSMLDLSTAYSVFANSGQRVSINPILQVQDSRGTVLEQMPLKEITSDEAQKSNVYDLVSIGTRYYLPGQRSNVRVISPGTAFLISHILYDNGARSATFGPVSYLNIAKHPEVSVKTGTTNDKRDNWTIGYNPDIEAAVWVGNNDNSAMSAIASGVTGASPIWNKIITYALKDYPQHWPTQPADVTGALVCSLSGLKAPENPDPGWCPTRYEYFLRDAVPPVQAEGNRRDIPMFTSAPASPEDIAKHPDQIHTENHSVIYDVLGLPLCLDCAGGYGGSDLVKLDRYGKAIK